MGTNRLAGNIRNAAGTASSLWDVTSLPGRLWVGSNKRCKQLVRSNKLAGSIRDVTGKAGSLWVVTS